MKIDFNNIYNQDKILFPKIIKNLKKIIKKGNFILEMRLKILKKLVKIYKNEILCRMW